MIKIKSIDGLLEEFGTTTFSDDVHDHSLKMKIIMNLIGLDGETSK